jgi:hypothetical protein
MLSSAANRSIVGILFIGASILSLGQEKSKPKKGAFYMSQELWKCIIWGGDPSKIDITVLPEDVQGRVKIYKENYKAFESLLANPREAKEGSRNYEWLNQYYYAQMLALEKSISCFIGWPDQKVQSEIAAYVLMKPGCYEWEGMSECPASEIKHAEKYLSCFPDTPLKPYLLVLLVHRYRSITECGDITEDQDALKKYKKKYFAALAKAKKEGNEWVAFICDSIDKAPFAYSDWQKKKAVGMP